MEKKHFGRKRECMIRRKRDGEWGSDISLWQRIPRPRVIRTCATIWSISNPWATFTLMRLKQDGEVGRGRLRGVKGESRGNEAGGGTHAMFSRGAPDEGASRVSLSSGKSAWETRCVITYAGRQSKCEIWLKVQIWLDPSVYNFSKSYSVTVTISTLIQIL